MVASRPSQRMRIAMIAERGAQNELLRYTDRQLYDYVTYRVPWLAGARFTRDDVHVYSIARSLAERFWAPGAALAGHAAHTTHPAGATGMNLAISGAARLVELAAPCWRPRRTIPPRWTRRSTPTRQSGGGRRRRPGTEPRAVAARSLGPDDCHLDPHAYARNADPTSGWGAACAGWGEDPAALMRAAGY